MDLRPYTDAMKVDILAVLENPDLGVFELRKIQNIAKLMVDLTNSNETYSEQDGVGAATRDSESIAPTLHQALMSRTFDGESALRGAYIALLEQYSELKGAAVEVQDLHRRLAEGNRRGDLAGQLGLPALPDVLGKVRRLEAGVKEANPGLTAGELEEAAEAAEEESEST